MALDTQDLLAGRYRKLRSIGAGGMARVFLAEDERLGRRVAIKVLHAESPAATAERFEREAKLGASLNHPNLVAIYDIATEAESVLIVMEYVEGETLGSAIAGGPLSPARVVSIVHDVAAALAHAHAHGVVHRDVKPANILLRPDGVAKLADLGIATAAESTSITKSGMVLGTASYMAPEQLDGQKAGPRADIYSLAAVAYETLSGRKAREGDTPMEVAHRVISDPPPDLREAWTEAPAGAAEAITKGMARRPEDRPASSGEFATALQRGLEGREGRVVAAAAVPEAVPAAKAAPARIPPTDRRQGTRRVPEAPATYSPRRQRPSWLPAAAAVAVLCLLAVVAFATLGGGGGGGGGEADSNSKASDQEAGKSESDRGEGGTSSGGSGSTAGSGDGGATPEAGSGSPPPAGGSSSQNAAALNDQGFKLMGQGRYDQAVPVLQKAVAAYPEGSKDLTYAFALYNLGRSLRLAGRPKEAVPILEKRLTIPNQTGTVRRELKAARRAAG